MIKEKFLIHVLDQHVCFKPVLHKINRLVKLKGKAWPVMMSDPCFKGFKFQHRCSGR